MTPEKIWSVFCKENIMILTRWKTLLDAKIILKVSVTEGESLTSGEVRTHKYFILYNTVLSVTCLYKVCVLPKAARLLKTLLPFHLEWKIFSKCKYKKMTNLDKLTEICFANRRM